MKAVIQRVLRASVKVDGQLVSSIDRGLLVLVGISKADSSTNAKPSADFEYIQNKILNGRYWNNEETGKDWDCTVVQKKYEVLVVSQFTLYGAFKGNKLDFHNAKKTNEAEEIYNSFVKKLKAKYGDSKVKEGKFGAMMEVELVNDGPVTVIVDSKVKDSSDFKETD